MTKSMRSVAQKGLVLLGAATALAPESIFFSDASNLARRDSDNARGPGSCSTRGAGRCPEYCTGRCT